MQYTIPLENIGETTVFANNFAKIISAPLVISLNGTLGAGKTTFVRSILQYLGVMGAIKSPTYAFVEEYSLPEFNFYHFDLYRFTDKEEWLYAGFDDYFNDNSVCCIEWANLADGLIPTIDLQVDLHIDTPISRVLTINGLSSKGTKCLSQLIQHGAK